MYNAAFEKIVLVICGALGADWGHKNILLFVLNAHSDS